MNKEEIVNEVMGSFKMTVDTKGIKKLEEYIDNIEQQNKKYKEVIDKAIEWVYIVQQNKDNKHLEPIICTDELDELLDILKEADKEV